MGMFSKKIKYCLSCHGLATDIFRKVRKIINFSIIITMFLLAIFQAGVFASENTLSTGSEAPIFQLSSLEGELINLEDYQGYQNDFVILYFYSEKEEQTKVGIDWLFNILNQCQPKKNYSTLLINTCKMESEENLSSMRIYWQKQENHFKVLMDYDCEVSKGLYQVQKLPTVFILDRGLTIKKNYPGLSSRMEKNLEQYISFVFNCQKESSNGNSCDDGSCSPPE
jgi:peroxiredoxin